MVTPIESLFSRLNPSNYRVTSSPDDRYNCVAGAMRDTSRWWWPGDPAITFWPLGVPRRESIEAFLAALATERYVSTEDEQVAPEFDRLALYANSEGVPTHVCRQIETGRWSSKLGRMEDIEHDLRDLEGELYGKVVMIFKRGRL